MSYSGEIMKHFENPHNVGGFNENSCDVGTAMVEEPISGDVLKLQIKVNHQGIIAEAKFKAQGGVPIIASGSWLTQWLNGRRLAEAGKIHNTQIAEALALPPVKVHCAVLAEEAVKAAIADYAVKQANGAGTEKKPSLFT
jgi:nitrogen fixation NifU-like protein